MLPLRFAPAALPLKLAVTAEPLTVNGPDEDTDSGGRKPAGVCGIGPVFKTVMVLGNIPLRPLSEPAELKPVRVPDRFSAVALPLMRVLLSPVPLSVSILAVFSVPVEQLPVRAFDQAGLIPEIE